MGSSDGGPDVFLGLLSALTLCTHTFNSFLGLRDLKCAVQELSSYRVGACDYRIDVLLVEFMCLVFTHMPGESYRS